MSQTQILADSSHIAIAEMEQPLTVKDAARFLGVSPQTVYLWVERKQIPHLRVMGPEHPISEIGPRALPQPLQAGGGGWHDHDESEFWDRSATVFARKAKCANERAAGNRS